MPYATPEGLEQEHGALSKKAEANLARLQERGITAEFLTGYAAKLQTMKDASTAHLGKTSDKEQLSAAELTAKGELLADVRLIQRGAKRAFPKGGPQLREFHVGDKYNHSTALLCLWADDIAKAWVKYQPVLVNKGRLLKRDVDTMVANAAVLDNANVVQEDAKRNESPQATTAFLKAMEDVEADADAIYGAAEAEFAKDPLALGEFEKLKPLRYAVERPPKGTTPPPADSTKN